MHIFLIVSKSDIYFVILHTKTHTMYKMVRLTQEAKELLDSLIVEQKFKNISEGIISVAWFFRNNKVSSRDILGSNPNREIKEDIQNLKKYIATDSQSLRKRYGALERDYFKTFDRKIETIYQKIIIENSLKKERINEQDITTSQVSNLDNNSSQKDKIKIKQQSDSLNNYQKIVNTQERTQRNERHIISKIKENISYERSTFGKTKTILNFSQEELEKLFNINL
jgi:hypothetical protein